MVRAAMLGILVTLVIVILLAVYVWYVLAPGADEIVGWPIGHPTAVMGE